MSACRRLRVDLCLLPTKNLSPSGQRPQNKTIILNIIEENIGNSLEWIDTGDNFLNKIPMTQALLSTIGKINLIQIKKLI